MKTYLQLLDVNRSDILYIFKIVENQKYIQIFYYKIQNLLHAIIMLKGLEDGQEDVSSYQLILRKRRRYLKFKEEALVCKLCWRCL